MRSDEKSFFLSFWFWLAPGKWASGQVSVGEWSLDVLEGGRAGAKVTRSSH